MDSLTQIVLGAACGEAVLGKKIGNKALLFGAVGGTIPDLDVFVGKLLYSNEIDRLLFHRGFMHSMLFAILGAFVFGWVTYTLYNTGKRKHHSVFKDWILMYGLALSTHSLLDAFTGYGTQLLAPFTNYRFAFNNIAVVDVFYTLPFMGCLIILMCYKRNSTKRKMWLKRSLLISSSYMLLTIGNKLYVNSVFKASIEAEGINYQRFQTQPSLFTNVLWYATVETSNSYYVGYYSNFDSENRVTDWQKIDKTTYNISQDKDIKCLSWFSKGYFNLYKTKSHNEFIYTDLRYPLLDPKDPLSSVFSFQIKKDKLRWDMTPFQSSVRNKDFREVFGPMFKRMKGI